MMQRTETRPTILLVEDYTDSRQILTLLLEGMDYRVLPAANAKDALTLAANNDIDLLLTDFDLPDMIGPAVVHYVRQFAHRPAHIPAIMLTASDVEEHRALAAEAGCEAFVIKPLDFDELEAIIKRLLQQRLQDNSLHGNKNVNVDPCPTSL